MVNNNFLRWHTPPELDGFIQGDALASGPVDCLALQDYLLPARRSDTIRFYWQNDLGKTLPVMLVRNGVALQSAGDIGQLAGLYGDATIPDSLPLGVYQLLIYEEVKNYTSDWVTTSETCVLNGDGQRTGEQDIEEARDYEIELKSVAISDCFKVGIHRETSVIRFRSRGVAFHFDYSGDEAFFQQFRLRVEVRNQEYPEDEVIYRRSNGYRDIISASIDEKSELNIDALPDRLHQCLVSACKHEYFYVNGCQYAAIGAYNIEKNENGRGHRAASIELYNQDFDLSSGGCGVVPAAIGQMGMLEYNNNDFIQPDYA